MKKFATTIEIKNGQSDIEITADKIFLKLDDGRYRISIKPVKPPKKMSFSQAMYGYLFGVVYPGIAVATGYATSIETATKNDIDVIDSAMKDLYGTIFNKDSGIYEKLRKRDMSRAVACAYVDAVVSWGRENGADIPPCEYDLSSYGIK